MTYREAFNQKIQDTAFMAQAITEKPNRVEAWPLIEEEMAARQAARNVKVK